jgi:hypothetical protein
MRKGSRARPHSRRKPGVGDSEIVIHPDGRVSIVRVTTGLAQVARVLAEQQVATPEETDGADEA